MFFHSSNVVYVSRLKRFLRAFQRRNHLVAPGVEFGIFFLEFRMRKHIINGTADSLVKTDFGAKIRHGTLEFGIVKHHGVRLVADEASKQVIIAYIRKELRRHVVRLEFDTESIGNRLVNLIPGERFVTRNLERFSDSMDVPHQAHKAAGKVGVECHGPEARAVAVNNDGLALEHALCHLPATVLAVNAQRDAARRVMAMLIVPVPPIKRAIILSM